MAFSLRLLLWAVVQPIAGREGNLDGDSASPGHIDLALKAKAHVQKRRVAGVGHGDFPAEVYEDGWKWAEGLRRDRPDKVSVCAPYSPTVEF